MIRRFVLAAALGLVGAALAATGGSAAPRPPSSSSAAFSNTRLTVPLTQSFPGVVAKTTGDSEPSISIGQTGPASSRMAVGGLAWIPFAVNMWTGQAGSVPSFFGAMDTSIPERGARIGLGDGDEDIDIASTGTTHLADLDFVFNPTFNALQLGVSVTNCPLGASGPSDCGTHVLDTAGADRQWITSIGSTVWVSYHDSGNSTLIHVQRSTDDGNTWRSVGSPIPGQGAATGDATFNNDQGPIVADPTTGDLFDVYAAGEPGIQKGTTATFNNMFVSRSTDGGKSWVSKQIFHAPLFTALNNIFPSLAVDPKTGFVYVVWTDQHGVSLSISTNHGDTFSPARTITTAPTTVMPWVAASGGKVDVVYYGTSAASKDDANAVWNTFDAQSVNSGLTFDELKVSKTPNHFGAICTNGTGCRNPLVTRTLLDLFEVSENPSTGKASLVYTDDTFHTWTLDGTSLPLPEIVLAQEN